MVLCVRLMTEVGNVHLSEGVYTARWLNANATASPVFHPALLYMFSCAFRTAIAQLGERQTVEEGPQFDPGSWHLCCLGQGSG